MFMHYMAYHYYLYNHWTTVQYAYDLITNHNNNLSSMACTLALSIGVYWPLAVLVVCVFV